MSTHATSTFEIETWDEKPYDEQEGARLTRTHLAKTFRGDVEGESTAECLMAYGAEEGSAAYVGFERIVGRVHGRLGSFVLHHNATMERGGGKATWSVVPDSGTGELRGEAQIIVEPGGGHTFTLDYDFEQLPSRAVLARDDVYVGGGWETYDPWSPPNEPDDLRRHIRQGPPRLD